MTLSPLRAGAFAALCFAAGGLLTRQIDVHAAASHVYELRVYHVLPGRMAALQARFRDHTITIFNRHHMTSVGYWVPQDPAQKESTLIYILEHPSHDAATKNWNDFRTDPEWQAVAKASEADGKIVEKVDSTFMDPTDFSKLK